MNKKLKALTGKASEAAQNGNLEELRKCLKDANLLKLDGNQLFDKVKDIYHEVDYKLNFEQYSELLDFSLKGAASKGYLDIVKYLLKSSELRKHPNIHADNDYPFNFALAEKHIDVLKFFIVDCQIDRTWDIDKQLDKNKNKNISSVETISLVEQVETMFKNRELYNDLQNKIGTQDKIKEIREKSQDDLTVKPKLKI